MAVMRTFQIDETTFDMVQIGGKIQIEEGRRAVD